MGVPINIVIKIPIKIPIKIVIKIMGASKGGKPHGVLRLLRALTPSGILAILRGSGANLTQNRAWGLAAVE